MTSDAFQNILVLTGPTGCGKSALAMQLGEVLGAEIVSMDSMAVYRGMDIGTAKPGQEERTRVRHHLLDLLDPWESASVAWWLQQAGDAVRDIEQRGKRALLVGGTPLYLKALLLGLFDGPPANEQIRRQLTEEVQHVGCQILHDRLTRLDPAAGRRIHPHDVRRIIRELEVWELTGRPISSWQQQWSRQENQGEEESPVSECNLHLATMSRVLWLDLPRDELYLRIDARVRGMIEAGLVDEVAALRKLPHPVSREARQAVGYKEMFDYLDGELDLEAAIRSMQTRSRNLAKRQLTWFRHLPECKPVTPQLTFAAWDLTIKG